MPNVGSLIATSVLGLTAGSIAAYAVAATVNIGIAFGLSYVAQSLSGTEETPSSTGFRGEIAAGGVVPRSIIVGKWATSGSLVYHNTWGDTAKTPNAFYTRVIALSDLPVTGLTGLLVNGERVTFDPEASQAGAGYAIPQYTKNGKEHLWIRFHDGTQTAADGFLLTRFPSGSRAWSSDMVGEGVAYAVVTARINDELFSGLPEFLFELDGIPIYDIRKDSTAGGSGAHRWDDPGTWEFSENAAIIIYNLLRGLHYEGEWFYGLQTVSGAQLPYASWAAAANECDVLITNADSSTERQFRAGGEISVNVEPGDEIEEFLKACNGRLAEIGGTYKIHVGAAGAAVLSFTDSNIVITEDQTFDAYPSIENTVNGIEATYVARAEAWQPKSAPPRYNATLEAEDGRRSVASVDYPRVRYPWQVQRLMKAALAEARRARKHVFTLPPDAWPLEPIDFVSWTSARNGYENKLFRVDRATDKANLDVVVYLTEVDPSDYDWSAATDELEEVDGEIVTIYPTAQAIIDFSASPTTVPGANGIGRAGILLEWDPDVDDVNGVRFQVKLAGHADNDLILDSQTDAVEAGGIKISHNILKKTAYEVRGRYRTNSNREMSWSGWLAVTTPDVRITQDELANELQELIIGARGDFADAVAEARNLLDQLAAGTALAISTQDHERQVVFSALAGEVASRQAQIAQIIEAYVTADQAVANLVTALRTDFDGNAALVTEQLTALSDADVAQAASITAVEAQTDQISASGLIKLEAKAAPAGVTARFSVFLRASEAGAWKEAGFFLDIVGGVARVFFKVDQFVIGDATTGVLPFIYSGGKIILTSNVIVRTVNSVVQLDIAGDRILFVEPS